MKDNIEKLLEDSYSRAIEAYQSYLIRYKEWMHLYALFTGVFFIAYYTVDLNSNIAVIIIILGFITSLSWLGSFEGHYAWLKSWTNILHFHEENYIASVKQKLRENESTDFDADKLRLYTVVDKSITNKRGFSTQKISRCFIYLTIIAWNVLLIFIIVCKFCGTKQFDYNCMCVIFNIALLIILLFLFLCFFRKILLSNTDNMKDLKSKNI